MQKTIDVTDELKVYVNSHGTPDLYFKGAHGLRMIINDPSDDTPQKLMRTGQRIAARETLMSRYRNIDTTVGLFHLLVRELGLNQAVREVEALGNTVRVRENGNTGPASPDTLPFSYNHITDPTDQLLYEHSGSRFHFQLSLAGDEVAFFHRTLPGSPFRHYKDIEPDIRRFAVKRLFEIYRADPTKQHLERVNDLWFAGDLGL